MRSHANDATVPAYEIEVTRGRPVVDDLYPCDRGLTPAHTVGEIEEIRTVAGPSSAEQCVFIGVAPADDTIAHTGS